MKKLITSLLLILTISLSLSANPYSGKVSLVIIDAGHGGKDPGAMSGGINEKDVVLDIALRLQHKLADRGYETIMTRSDDTFLELQERCDVANGITFPKDGYPIFVSIHANSATSSDASGFEVFVKGSDKSAPFISSATSDSMILKYSSYTRSQLNRFADIVSARLADRVIYEVSQSFPTTRLRGVKSGNLWVLNGTWMPAILIETAFISNPQERSNLIDPLWQDEMAEAIAEAISAF